MNSNPQNKKLRYDLSNYTILVVEDSSYMQVLMSSMLKAFDVGDIMVCSSSKEAQDILTLTQARVRSRYATFVDIVVTDWLMPNGSGRDLLKWVRGHESDAIKYMPVIVTSAYTTEFVTSESRDLGANETLVKPLSGNAIASRICSVIDCPRPFIKAPDFFGPDRRRQDLPYRGVDRRVMSPDRIKVRHVRPEE